MVQAVKTDLNVPLVLQHPQGHQVQSVLRQVRMDLKLHKVRLLVNRMVHLVLQDQWLHPQDLWEVKMVFKDHRQLQICHSIKTVLRDPLLHKQDLWQVHLVL